MADNASSPATRRRPMSHFVNGDRIRIAHGKLAGLTGLVTHPSDRFDRVLAIDGWPAGVYLSAVDAAAVLLESEGSLGRSRRHSDN